MNNELENEIKKAADLLSNNWIFQNNFDDYKSNFIYKVKTINEVYNESKNNGIDFQYALHRWYNFNTSILSENIFVELGATKESNPKHKEIDLYIDGIPFDVKLTVYPKKLEKENLDLRSRNDKNNLIRWLYNNQSQQQRKHLKNRLFIVCKGNSINENQKLKSDFNQIRQKVKDFIKYSSINGFNELEIDDNNIKYTVKSDIIYISSNE